MNQKFSVLLIFASLLLGVSAYAGSGSAFTRFFDDWDKWEISRLDTDYVALPSQWWRVGVLGALQNTNINVSDYSMMYGMFGNADSDRKLKLGFQGAFRGWGASYSFDLDGSDRFFNFLYFGNAFGVEFVDNRTHSLNGKVDAFAWGLDADFGFVPNETPVKILKDDILHHCILVDGYFVFNSRKFSFPAAMDLSYLQKKSAGSVLLGAAFVYNDFAYLRNGELFAMSGVENIKISEFTFGAGYGYNFAYRFLQNNQFLVHFSLLPMISVWNRFNVDCDEHSLAAGLNGSQKHGHYWIWDDFKNDNLQFVWFYRSSFTYSYKNFYIGVKGEIIRQYLTKDDGLDLETDVLNVHGFAGIRF